MKKENTNTTVREQYSFKGTVGEFKNYILNHGELQEVKEEKNEN